MESFRGVIQKKRAMTGSSNASGDDMRKLMISESGPFPTLKEAELELVAQALQRAKGNQGIAAALLGISRPALNRRLARLKSSSAE
jgi:DNA-binding NtrC family response regulator